MAAMSVREHPEPGGALHQCAAVHAVHRRVQQVCSCLGNSSPTKDLTSTLSLEQTGRNVSDVFSRLRYSGFRLPSTHATSEHEHRIVILHPIGELSEVAAHVLHRREVVPRIFGEPFLVAPALDPGRGIYTVDPLRIEHRDEAPNRAVSTVLAKLNDLAAVGNRVPFDPDSQECNDEH